MSRYWLAMLLASAGVHAGQSLIQQPSACDQIKQNITDLLDMHPKSAPQSTQRNLSLAINVDGVLDHCAETEARNFLSKKLLHKKFLGDDGIHCKKLGDSIEKLMKDPRPTTAPQVNQFLSEAALQFKIYEQYCGKGEVEVYNLSLCYSGGSCG